MSKMSDRTWREDILSGVASVPARGKVDTMVVYGECAEAILTTHILHEVFIAAAEYGKGKLVVFSGEKYSEDMETPSSNSNLTQLRSNILKWLRPGQESHQVINVTDWKNVDVGEGQNKILLWQVSHPRKSQRFVKTVEEFVKNGGAAILTKTPTKYVKRHGQLSSSPVYQMLHEVGIYFGKRSSIHSNMNVADNEAHKIHVGRVIEEVISNPRKLTVYGSIFKHVLPSLPNKKEVRKKLKRLVDELDSLDIRYVPRGRRKRVKGKRGMNLLYFVDMFNWDPEFGKAPGVEKFPGDFEVEPELVCIEVSVDTKKQPEWHPVGAYLPPGGTVRFEVLEGSRGGWKVRVGAHSDNLTHKDVLWRWPVVMKQEPLKETVTEVFNPFGGSIYLQSPGKWRKLRVRISNVVETPLYDIQEENTEESWELMKKRPGLWADLRGKYIHITIPSTSIDDLTEKFVFTAITFWDRVIEHFHDLRGTNVEHGKRQWIVTDKQISAGGMHSGYPIMTHLEVAEPDSEKFALSTEPGFHWGLFHEIGHNMQKWEWTPRSHIEITVNIFSIYGMYMMYGIEPWENRNMIRATDKMKRYLQGKVEKSTPFIGFAIYAQLARDFGFEVYKKVFRAYKQMRPKPDTKEEVLDVWYKTFSKTVGLNLMPLCNFWRVRISDEVAAELGSMTPYLPNDDLTSAVPKRVEQIIANYPGIVRTAGQVQFCDASEGACQADDEDEDDDEIVPEHDEIVAEHDEIVAEDDGIAPEDDD